MGRDSLKRSKIAPWAPWQASMIQRCPRSFFASLRLWVAPQGVEFSAVRGNR